MPERGPDTGQTCGLLGGADPDEQLQTAGHGLGVVPELVGGEPAAGRGGDGEQTGVRVERAAVGGGGAVDEVPAGRVGFGEQGPPGPDSGEREGGRGDSGRTLVCGEGDERHGFCVPLCSSEGSAVSRCGRGP